jgi:predicted acyl esterase
VCRAVTVDLAHTAYTFDKGHQLRLQVTSSSFPRYDRNRNIHPVEGREDYAVAVQVIFHDIDHPSSLILPSNGPAA